MSESRIETMLTAAVNGDTDIPEPKSRIEELLSLLVKNGGASSGGGGGSNVSTPDWLQNDETASDYIKNRPFYDCVGVIVPETELMGSDELVFPPSVVFEVVEGEDYIVTWNGVQYSCHGITFALDEDAGLYVQHIGNTSVFDGTDTGEPFAIITAQGQTMGVNLDGSPSVIVKIEGKTAKKIDEKYLPQINSVVYVPVTDSGASGAPEYSTTVTMGELKRAIDSGKFVIAKVTHTTSSPYAFHYCPLTQYDDNIVPYYVYFGNSDREMKFTVPDDFTMPDTLAGFDTIVYKVVKQ